MNNGIIASDTILADLPRLVISPRFEGEKKTYSGYYVDPVNPASSFTFDGATVDVQKPSQYYYVKNYKIKLGNGFTLPDGSEEKKTEQPRRYETCRECGLEWNVSKYQEIPPGGYICPWCWSKNKNK